MRLINTFEIYIDHLPVDWSDELQAHVINDDHDFCVLLENFMRSNDRIFDGYYAYSYFGSWGLNLTDMTVSVLDMYVGKPINN